VTGAAPRRIGSGAVIDLGIIVIGLLGIVLLLVARTLQTVGESPPPLDLALDLTPVAAGLDGPVLLLGAGDGSGERYLVEQPGLILRMTADGALDPTPFLDIRDRVLSLRERGLLGLAFHPDFAEDRRFYVLYSRRTDGATSISEFTAGQDGLAQPGTERALLVIPQFSTMHKGGMIAFDTDGKLLIGIGDGSTGNDPQGQALDPASLLGKLLRIDVDRGYPYLAPTDNGFAGDPGARPEVQAIGLRNPWRFSVDGLTGDVYIGDVGQAAFEEIDVLRRGASRVSFGWADMEGNDCFYGRPCDPSAHQAPAVSYAHDDGGAGRCAVVGGFAYRGASGTMPAGTYLYADYCSGSIWAVPVEQLLSGPAQPTIVGHVPSDMGHVQSFGQDDAGELYLLTDAGLVLAIEAVPVAA
jgi:glucose/arabinose dehydrogenase